MPRDIARFLAEFNACQEEALTLFDDLARGGGAFLSKQRQELQGAGVDLRRRG